MTYLPFFGKFAKKFISNMEKELLNQGVTISTAPFIRDQVSDSPLYTSQQGIGVYKTAEASAANHMPFSAPRNLSSISVTFASGNITGVANGTYVLLGGTRTTRFDVAKTIADATGNLATSNFVCPDFERNGAQLNDANQVANGIPYNIGNPVKNFSGLFRFGFINEMFMLSKEKMVLKVSAVPPASLLGQTYSTYVFNGSSYSQKTNELALVNDQNSFNNNVTIVSLPYDFSGFTVYVFRIPNGQLWSFTVQVVDCPILA